MGRGLWGDCLGHRQAKTKAYSGRDTGEDCSGLSERAHVYQQASRNISHVVARISWRRCGLYPCRSSVHRVQRRTLLRDPSG